MSNLSGVEKQIGDVIRDYYFEQSKDEKWVLPVFKHVDRILNIIKEDVIDGEVVE